MSATLHTLLPSADYDVDIETVTILDVHITAADDVDNLLAKIEIELNVRGPVLWLFMRDFELPDIDQRHLGQSFVQNILPRLQAYATYHKVQMVSFAMNTPPEWLRIFAQSNAFQYIQVEELPEGASEADPAAQLINQVRLEVADAPLPLLTMRVETN